MDVLSGKIIRSDYRGQPLSFFVEDPGDTIQKHHNQGNFYEKEELAIIERFFVRGGVFLDIGANVGNHALFAAKFLHSSQVILIEPNPVAMRILKANVELNNLMHRVDLSLLGLGLSDADGFAGVTSKDGNLGAARLSQSDSDAGIRLAVGDKILSGRKIDFIKIDVEGMEMQVLKGLRGVIATNRPTMFVEVEKGNRQSFLNLMKGTDYEIKETFKRYEINENFLVAPIESQS